MNAAVPSPFLQSLLGRDALTAEVRGAVDPATLYQEDWRFLTGARLRRIEQFAAGRLCARRALADLGLLACALAVNPDRTPRWPEEVVGSITHTTDYCAAAVARRSEFHAIGIDAEREAAVTLDLRSLFCTRAERAALERLSTTAAVRRLAVLFSAKEAFYKCQYPLCGEWIDFADVELELDEATGVFEVQPLRPILLTARHPGPWRGKACVSDGLVLSAVAIRVGA